LRIKDFVGKSQPRVLLQNRTDSNSLPGGDTTVLNETYYHLLQLGGRVAISLEENPNLAEYDLVHLNNISRTKDTLAQVINARNQNRPIILTPLYEDMDKYLLPATNLEALYLRLSETGTRLSLDEIMTVAGNLELERHPLDTPIARYLGIGDFKNQKSILENTDFILTSGKIEVNTIVEKFGYANKIETLNFGFNPEFITANGNEFRNKYGLKDFVLCVGRIEARKNQFALIEIFRTLPHLKLVLIGSFSDPSSKSKIIKYAPKNVIFIERLPFSELVSAFGAARVHVLASWYELPGVVSLEAAAAGCRIVSTSWGTAKDYFEEFIHYCEPNNFFSIRNAILDANECENSKSLREFVIESYSWEKTAGKLLEIYEKIFSRF